MQRVNLTFSFEEDYRMSEAFKSLRTNIEFCGSDVKTIAMTSCTPNEGKSSCAMEIAKAFAKAGNKTLLLDCDLRKSVLVGRYKTGGVRKGLTHALIGKAPIADVVYSTNVPNLFIIFSGPVPPNPSELLGGEEFEKMLKKLRDVFDYIIVDAPPLGSVIDAAVIGTKCDGMVLVIESNAISYRFAQSVKDQIDKSGCRILGAVLNKVDMSGGRYGHYGKYYGRYYGRYYGKYYGKYYGQYGEYGKYGSKGSHLISEEDALRGVTKQDTTRIILDDEIIGLDDALGDLEKPKKSIEDVTIKDDDLQI